MIIPFSGCWQVTITTSAAEQASFGSPKRFVIAGADSNNGIYPAEPAEVGFTICVCGASWTLTVENYLPFPNVNWHQSPVQVTNLAAGVQIAANDDDDAGGPFDDLILMCTRSICRPLRPIPNQKAGTWISWGVKVDAGGPTGNGGVPPWNPYVREFAAGLALADTAQLVHAELRPKVLELAAKQVTDAAHSVASNIIAVAKGG